MALPKYAEAENERRFLIARGQAPDLKGAACSLIKDLYVRDTRLRLRSMTDPATGQRVFKLCKKYPTDDPLSGPIVNVYLSSEEFALLSRLPGWFIRKKRHRLEVDGRTFAVDVFQGELSGLVLCEAEDESPEALSGVVPPPWVSAEVTADPFFTGGQLCKATPAELAERLAAV